MIVPILNFKHLAIKINTIRERMIYITDTQRAAKYAVALTNAKNNIKDNNDNKVVTITSLADTYLLAAGKEIIEDINSDYSLLLDKISKAKDIAYDLIGQEAIIAGLDAVCDSLPAEEQAHFSKLHISPLEDSTIQEIIYLQGVRDALKNPDLMRGLINVSDQLSHDLQSLDLPTAKQ